MGRSGSTLTDRETRMRRIIIIGSITLIAAIITGFLIVGIAQINCRSARVYCGYNLRQLGFALINYGDTDKHFPSAAMEHASLPPEKRLSWIVAAAPFIESDIYYSKMDKQKGWEADENRFAALMRMPILRCPGYPKRPPVSTFFPTHYLGISGVGHDAARLPEGDANAGFFGYERALSPADIQGRASTLMVMAETAWASGAWTAAGPPTTR